MIQVAAAVAGVAAADSLSDACRTRIDSGAVHFVRHEEIAVAWSAACPWIDTYDDGDVLTVLDGRLHNQAPEGQAELLLSRYRDRGADVAAGLLGDFVLIVVDRTARRLLVARDPVGVRPWYQTGGGSRHAGATDLATLIALPWVNRDISERIAVEYLAASFESRGETLYQGIRTLSPGTTWYHDGNQARSRQHHRWDVAPELDITWEDAAERCRAVLDEAVRSRLAFGGLPTSQVSGGLDSSSVVGTAVQLGYRDLAVGRLLFDGPRADERSYSDAVIRHWGLAEISAPPWVPTAEEACNLGLRLQRPLPDPHFTMFTSLSRKLLGTGRVDGLTGLGGDDAFVATSIASRFLSSVKLRQRTVLGQLTRWAVRHPLQAWPDLFRPTLHRLAWWKGSRPPFWVTGKAATSVGLPEFLRSRPAKLTGVAAIDERLGNFTSGYDAFILEAQAALNDVVGRRDSHPFLDPRLVTATYGLNPWWPIRDGHTRALQVAAYCDRLPPLVAGRRSKVEFSEIFWPQLLGNDTLEEVRTGPLRDYGWLNVEGFDALLVHAKEGKANAAIPLSRCVSLDRWLRQR